MAPRVRPLCGTTYQGRSCTLAAGHGGSRRVVAVSGDADARLAQRALSGGE